MTQMFQQPVPLLPLRLRRPQTPSFPPKRVQKQQQSIKIYNLPGEGWKATKKSPTKNLSLRPKKIIKFQNQIKWDGIKRNIKMFCIDNDSNIWHLVAILFRAGGRARFERTRQAQQTKGTENESAMNGMCELQHRLLKRCWHHSPLSHWYNSFEQLWYLSKL